MAAAALGTVRQHIRNIVSTQSDKTLSDVQLLGEFCANRNRTAFATVVERHGPMVLGVCRHVLHHQQDAEDAFQATFLVLARKAAAIRKKEALASWLHGVAFRMATNAKRSAARRRRHEGQAKTTLPRDPTWNLGWQEVQAILDEEIQRLPEKYRAVFVLCCQEGLSRAETGRQLGLKEGTISSRLDQARKRLQQRLARRGVTLAAVMGAAALSPSGSTAALAPGLISDTTRAAFQFVAGEEAASGLISARVAALTKGALKSMYVTRVKITIGLLLAMGLCGTTAGSLIYQTPAGDKHDPQQSSAVRRQGAPPGESRAEKPIEEEQRKALADFAQRYALKPGEIVKRVPPPFSPSRLVYHRQHYPKDDKAEDMMFLRWDNSLHFVGTIGGMKTDPHKVQLLFLFRYLPSMLGDFTHGHESAVQGDEDLLAASVAGDFVFRADVPVGQIIDKIGEILRNDCHLPVRLTLRDFKTYHLILVEREGPSVRKPSAAPSPDYVLAEKDKDIRKPSCERADYSKPNDYLFVDKSMGSPDRIRKVAASLNGTTPAQKIVAISKWIDSHLKHDDTCPYSWRDFDALVDDGRYGGCADHSVVFGALLRACGIPCVWVKTMDIDWIREFASNHGSCRSWRGHVYLEVYLHDRWMLLDAAQLVLYENYKTTERFFPGNRYAYDKGGSPYDLILSSRWEIWKKQTAAHFLNFNLDQLPIAFQQGKDLRDQGGVFITTITKMEQGDWTAAWQHASQRCAKLGYQVRLSFRGDYARLLPRTKGNHLIITCIGHQITLDEKLCSTHLPWSLADLQARLEKETKGVLRGKTRDGTLVVLVFAKDYPTLRLMIDDLTLE